MKANVSPSKANNAADWAEKKLSGGEERKRTTFAANKSHNQRSPLSPADWAYSIQNGLTLDEPPELKLGMVKVSAVLVTPPRRFSGLPAKNPPRPVVVEVCELTAAARPTGRSSRCRKLNVAANHGAECDQRRSIARLSHLSLNLRCEGRI